MGNCLRNTIDKAYFYSKSITDKCMRAIQPLSKQRNLPLITFKDDEQQVTIMSSEEIEKMVYHHKQNDNNPPNNFNEYKIIKTTNQDDELPSNTNEEKDKIDQIKNQINLINDEDEDEYKDNNDNNKDIENIIINNNNNDIETINNNDNNNNNEPNIDELKDAIFNAPDDEE